MAADTTYEFGVPAASVPAPGLTEPAAPATSISVLDGLLDDVGHALDQERITLGVQARPGWEVRYSVDVPYEELAQWRAAAIDPAIPGGMNELQVACAALASKCQAIVVDGEDVTDEHGVVTFASEALQRRLGVTRAVDAVRKLYRFDGHVVASGKELFRAAGYGQDASPTRR